MQQWWRQLRNYAHQQRCGWVRGNKGDSAEELQGAAVEDATLEVAATPLAKARGRTNGWNGNKVSCCKRWKRVLLVWLVVPVEAAGAAQVDGGTAAAATAVSTVLNYLAGLEGDTADDLEVLGKGEGVIRIMSTNLRRVERDKTGQDMSKVVWEQTMRAVEDAAVDICG